MVDNEPASRGFVIGARNARADRPILVDLPDRLAIRDADVFVHADTVDWRRRQMPPIFGPSFSTSLVMPCLVGRRARQLRGSR